MANDSRSKFERNEASKLDPAWEDKTPASAGKRFERAVHQREQQAASKPATPPQTVADDTTNRFQRHDAHVAAERRDTSAHDARVAKLEKDRQTWQQTNAPKSASGTPLDAKLQELRRKAREDVAQRKQQRAITINPSMIKAAIMLWRVEWENGRKFIPVEFNMVSFNNLIQTLAAKGDEITPELIDDAYLYAIGNNESGIIYLYTIEPTERKQVDGSVIRKRGAILHDTPPRMFPAYVWPDEAAVNQEADLKVALERTAAERKQALGMDFNELQRQVRAGNRTPDESAAGTGSVR